jgi:hypothetical protein
VLQGGNELCRIEGFDRGKAVSELKVSIEAEAGLVPALTRLINPESHVELQDHLTLEDAGMPSDHALAEGVIQLYAQKLKKVVVADELQIAPGEVTDSKLAVLCDSIRDNPPDILVLCGCCGVTNISYLVQLSTISHLDISGCSVGAKGGFQLAGVIKNMGAMLSLNLSNNGLGELVAPAVLSDGWSKPDPGNPDYRYQHTDGRHQEAPPGGKPEGAIAIANAISNMRAISSVNILKNKIPVEQAQELVKIMQTKEKLTTLCGLSRDETELDFSGQGLGAGDAVLIANDISDMGAISSVNLLSNDIGVEQAGALVIILKEHPILKSLCGNKGGETELDMSGKMKGAEDAIMLAAEIVDNRALTSLNLADNSLGELVPPEGWTKTGDGLFSPALWRHADGREQNQDPGSKPEGIIAIVNATPDMGAMTSLNLSKNELVANLGCGEYDYSGELHISFTPNICSNPIILVGIVALANAIPDMEALSKLAMRQNNINGAEAGKAFADMLAQNTVLKELDLSRQACGYGGTALDAAFAKEFAVGISNNGALAKLNISNTHIEQGESLQLITALCNTKGIELENDNESDSDYDY